MAPKFSWFKHEPAEWLLGEFRLQTSVMERGLYRDAHDLCLFHGSLPADPDSLRRSLACSEDEFRSGWTPRVAAEFPPDPKDSGRLINRSALIRLQEAERFDAKQRANGSKGGRPRANGNPTETQTEPTANPVVNPTETQTEPNSEPKKNTYIHTDRQTDTHKDSTDGTNPELPEWAHTGWERFIQKYPNRVEVDFAAQVWLGLVNDGIITAAAVPEVMAGLMRWRESDQWTRDDGRFVPSPVKWLRDRRWHDTPTPSAESRVAHKPKQSSDGVDPDVEWIAPWRIKDGKEAA